MTGACGWKWRHCGTGRRLLSSGLWGSWSRLVVEVHGAASLGECLPRDGPPPLGSFREDTQDLRGIAREVLAPRPDRGEQAMQHVDQVVLERHVAQAAGPVSLLESLER